ncbi:hypothetical protein [Flavobacterium maritimum]|uniref:hypothetical protein n=1 Tax=Flavobacterium maritimum TaxID=3149042 RepID=UPI0032B4B203
MNAFIILLKYKTSFLALMAASILLCLPITIGTGAKDTAYSRTGRDEETYGRAPETYKK